MTTYNIWIKDARKGWVSRVTEYATYHAAADDANAEIADGFATRETIRIVDSEGRVVTGDWWLT